MVILIYFTTYSDRTNNSNSKQVIDDILPKIEYTGYVCDELTCVSIKEKNNYIYVSTGLNKEEGVLLFKEISKIAKDFLDYTFVMTIANRYLKTEERQKGNLAHGRIMSQILELNLLIVLHILLMVDITLQLKSYKAKYRQL